jgi:hypothetical protein
MSFAAGKLISLIGTELIAHVIAHALVEVGTTWFRSAAHPGSRGLHPRLRPALAERNGVAPAEAVAALSHQPGRVRLRIRGLRDDAARAAAVVDALQALPGVRSASANPLTGNALVRYDPARVTLPRIQAALAPLSTSAVEPPATDGWHSGSGLVRVRDGIAAA